MPWLGFSFAKRGNTQTIAKPKANSSSSSSSATSSSSSTSFDDVDELDDVSDEKPSIRLLSPAEVESMKAENQQLKKLLESMMAEKEKANQTAAYPDLASSSSSSSTTHPTTTMTFQQVRDMNSVLNPSTTAASISPSAPPLETTTRRGSGSTSSLSASALSAEQLAPVDSFYASLRKSLAASSATTSTPVKSVPQSIKEVDEFADESDEFGAAPSTSPPSIDSITQPRTEDVAVVHNKHASVIIHKKPIHRPKDDDDETMGGGVGQPSSALARMDDFEDEFGMNGEGAMDAFTTGVGEEEEEEAAEDEVAVFNVENADWWLVVPHPDREDEELKAAPEPPLDPNEDEDGFVVVKNKDSIAALGEFISQMMSKHPEIRKLSPEQLKEMLESSLVEHGIKQPTTFGKAWQVGKQIYNVYSYGAWGMSLYQNETVMRLAAAGIIKAASWTCVFLL